jgi:hypothetical protein
MEASVATLQSAIKYEVEVSEQGWIGLQVPFAAGARVTIFVIKEQEIDNSLADLVTASESSLEFWDNPLDDEDWNNA